MKTRPFPTSAALLWLYAAVLAFFGFRELRRHLHAHRSDLLEKRRVKAPEYFDPMEVIDAACDYADAEHCVVLFQVEGIEMEARPGEYRPGLMRRYIAAEIDRDRASPPSPEPIDPSPVDPTR